MIASCIKPAAASVCCDDLKATFQQYTHQQIDCQISATLCVSLYTIIGGALRKRVFDGAYYLLFAVSRRAA